MDYTAIEKQRTELEHSNSSYFHLVVYLFFQEAAWLNGEGAGFACGSSGFKSHSDHCLDMSWVIPESYPPRFVNSQLVCLTPVGFFFSIFMKVPNSEKLVSQLLQNPSIIFFLTCFSPICFPLGELTFNGMVNCCFKRRILTPSFLNQEHFYYVLNNNLYEHKTYKLKLTKLPSAQRKIILVEMFFP